MSTPKPATPIIPVRDNDTYEFLTGDAADTEAIDLFGDALAVRFDAITIPVDGPHARHENCPSMSFSPTSTRKGNALWQAH